MEDLRWNLKNKPLHLLNLLASSAPTWALYPRLQVPTGAWRSGVVEVANLPDWGLELWWGMFTPLWTLEYSCELTSWAMSWKPEATTAS